MGLRFYKKGTNMEKKYTFDDKGFCKVSSATLKLKDPLISTIDYEQILFENPYFSYLELMIHSNMYNFKFTSINNYDKKHESLIDEIINHYIDCKDFYDYFKLITKDFNEEYAITFYENTIKKLKLNYNNLLLRILDILNNKDIKINIDNQFIQQANNKINNINFKYPEMYEKYFNFHQVNDTDEYKKNINLANNKISSLNYNVNNNLKLFLIKSYC